MHIILNLHPIIPLSFAMLSLIFLPARRLNYLFAGPAFTLNRGLTA